MNRRLILLVVAAGIIAGTGCPPNAGPIASLEPMPWVEANGTNANSGFNAVHSPLATLDRQIWNASIGRLTQSSPTIGPDGTIWIANANGELVAINPDGSPHRRRSLDDFILASPAVNSATNEIFVVGEHTVAPNKFTSRVYRLDAGAALLNVSSEPLVSAAAPKLWDHYIFLPTSGELVVLDQASLAIVAHETTNSCFDIICGDSVLGDVFGTIVDCVINRGCPFTGQAESGPEESAGVAIIDSAAIVDDSSKPIVVAMSPQCAVGFRFDPTASHPLEIIWHQALVPVDCDFQTVRSTAPTVVAGGAAVVFGTEHGRVLELDTLTGQVLFDRQLSEPVQSAPVSNGLGPIYVVEQRHLATLNSSGAVISEVPLLGTGLTAALSLDHVYVGTSQGIHTFDTLPAQSSPFADVENGFGAFKIALAEDGTLYASSPTVDSENIVGGLLFAYRAP